MRRLRAMSLSSSSSRLHPHPDRPRTAAPKPQRRRPCGASVRRTVRAPTLGLGPIQPVQQTTPPLRIWPMPRSGRGGADVPRHLLPDRGNQHHLGATSAATRTTTTGARRRATRPNAGRSDSVGWDGGREREKKKKKKDPGCAPERVALPTQSHSLTRTPAAVQCLSLAAHSWASFRYLGSPVFR